ncbi:ZGRF1 protein, partial [Bucco capensis]|nr:ZGRF1 protein [Bucco capensis]
VLYTHQKMKKSKTWQDGILRIRTDRNKAILFDDKGQCLESIFIKSQLNAGDNLESERYLISIEALKMTEKSFEDQPRKAEAPAVDRNAVKPGGLPPRHLSVGLKRKFTGFQGPRQVEKKMSTMEDGENPTILPLSKQCQGTLPSKFYITSPLFSTICKKDEETNLSADFHEDVCPDNEREHTSVSSLLSAPFLDRCEETEQQNSVQSIVKPECPLITVQTQSSSQPSSHRAVSHNIRSTAQIIALLKSKPTQECREQTMPGVSKCIPRFQGSENADSLYNQKSTILPDFSGDPAKRLIQNIQQLPFAKGIVNDKKEWNAEMLPNSAEEYCDKVVTGQRDDKKANNLSQDLQDLCNTNSCFLPESTISRMTDTQFVLSSGDISCSASPITFEKNLSRYRERSVADGLKENSSVKFQSELQPGQNSEGLPSDLELSVDGTLTEMAVVKEKFKCLTLDGENDGNHCTRGISSQLCDNNIGDTGRTAEDSANQTKIKVELLADGHRVKEINESQLNIEATNNERDLGGSAIHSINGTSWIESKPSHLLPGDTNVNESLPETSMFEQTESNPCISTSRIISAMDKRTEVVTHLGCMKSPCVDLEHSWSTKSDDIKLCSPLLALSQKSDPGWKGHSSPEKTAIGETEFGNAETPNAFLEACKGERIGTDYQKCMAIAEKSSDLPDLVNNIALIRALTQHSTALESLQKIEETNSILHE